MHSSIAAGGAGPGSVRVPTVLGLTDRATSVSATAVLIVTKLSQILAVEKGVEVDRPAQGDGRLPSDPEGAAAVRHLRTYQPIDDEGERLPPGADPGAAQAAQNVHAGRAFSLARLFDR